MKIKYSSLTAIANARPVSPEKDGCFLHVIKLGLILALGEKGLLTDLQMRIAMEELGGRA